MREKKTGWITLYSSFLILSLFLIARFLRQSNSDFLFKSALGYAFINYLPGEKKAIVNQVVTLRLLFFCLQRNRDVIPAVSKMKSVISHFPGHNGREMEWLKMNLSFQVIHK